MFLGVVVFAVGLVEGIFAFFLGGNLAAPLADLRREVRRLRRLLSAHSRGMVFVEFHATAWGVNDEDALGTRFFQEVIHARGKFAFTQHGILAVVQVPHVAHD